MKFYYKKAKEYAIKKEIVIACQQPLILISTQRHLNYVIYTNRKSENNQFWGE
jgi:hypothetical protein